MINVIIICITAHYLCFWRMAVCCKAYSVRFPHKFLIMISYFDIQYASLFTPSEQLIACFFSVVLPHVYHCWIRWRACIPFNTCFTLDLHGATQTLISRQLVSCNIWMFSHGELADTVIYLNNPNLVYLWFSLEIKFWENNWQQSGRGFKSFSKSINKKIKKKKKKNCPHVFRQLIQFWLYRPAYCIWISNFETK